MDGVRQHVSRNRTRAVAGSPHVGDSLSTEEVARRIAADFDEMPDLRVTAAQAARFWRIDLQAAHHVLSRMVANGYLCFIRGTYRRA